MKTNFTRACVLLALLLCGCGGGDDEEERATVGPVDCKARPEVCA